MTRLTILGFLLLSGFFYLTGKPIDQSTADNTLSAGLLEEKAQSTIPAAVPQQPAATRTRMAGAAVLPDLPVRNPNRLMETTAALPQKVAEATAATTSDAEYGATSATATATPLFKGYQERFAEPKPAVLGPRLTAVLIKRELRRLGCYDGNISGVWDDDARQAVELYNIRASASMAGESPEVATLEALQRQTKPVCAEGADGNGAHIATTTVTAATIAAIRQSARDASDGRGDRNLEWKPKTPRTSVAFEAPKRRIREDTQVSAVEEQQTEVYRVAPAKVRRRSERASRFKGYAVAAPAIKSKTKVRGWSRYRPRKKFGFSAKAGSFQLNY